MFNKDNIKKCCCFPIFFEEKATKTDVKCAIERINQLERLISTVVENKKLSGQIEGYMCKKTKKRKKKKTPSVSKSRSKVLVKICSNNNPDKMLIKLSCGCILKKTQDSQSTHVSIPSSSAVKSTSGKLDTPCQKTGFRVKNTIKFTSDVSPHGSALKLLLKNDPVKVSKEQVFQEPNIIKSLSTCGCGFEQCKMEWNFSCSDRNNTQTLNPAFNPKKQLIDCGINTLEEDTLEGNTQKKVVCKDVGSITCSDDGSSVSPFTRQMCTSTQTYNNSCQDSFILGVGSKDSRLHCLPSSMLARGKYRKNNCNPIRYQVSSSNLNQMSKCPEYRSKVSLLPPKKTKFKCCNRKKKASFYIRETDGCPEELILVPSKKVLSKNKKSNYEDMKWGSSDIETPCVLPSCSTNCSELSDKSYTFEEIPVHKKNTFEIEKVVKNQAPQHIVKLKQPQPTYILVQPSKKGRNLEEYVVQSVFQNLTDSTASSYKERSK